MREHEFHQINGPKQDEMKEENENPPPTKKSTKKETITIKDDSKREEVCLKKNLFNIFITKNFMKLHITGQRGHFSPPS